MIHIKNNLYKNTCSFAKSLIASAVIENYIGKYSPVLKKKRVSF